MARKQYTIDDRANVRALLVQGYSHKAIERKTGISHHTVAVWRDQLPDIAPEQEQLLNRQTMQIALRSGERMLVGLDKVEEQGTEDKHFISFNAMRGTSIDKMDVQHGMGKGNVNILFLTQQMARERGAKVIPGQYEVLPEPTD